MMLVKNFIKESGIHGIGIYAGQFIPQGTIIWKFDPYIDRIYTDREIENAKPEARDFIKHYSYKADDNLWVLCGDNGRYFNHSENPNTDGVEDELYGMTVANRDITEGEEMTCNYFEIDNDVNRKLGK